MPITFTFDPEPPPAVEPAEPAEPYPQEAFLPVDGLHDVFYGGAPGGSMAEVAIPQPEDSAAADSAIRHVVHVIKEGLEAVDEALDPDDTPLTDLVTHTHLRSQRLAAGLSQATLAQRAGMTQGYITQIETGRRRPTERVVAAYRAAVAPDER